MATVQLEFKLNPANRSSEFLTLGSGPIPIALMPNPRARRYVLRLRPDGSARVTIPRGGSKSEALRFAERNAAWLERALRKLASLPTRAEAWGVGTEILFRGTMT